MDCGRTVLIVSNGLETALHAPKTSRQLYGKMALTAMFLQNLRGFQAAFSIYGYTFARTRPQRAGNTKSGFLTQYAHPATG